MPLWMHHIQRPPPVLLLALVRPCQGQLLNIYFKDIRCIFRGAGGRRPEFGYFCAFIESCSNPFEGGSGAASWQSSPFTGRQSRNLSEFVESFGICRVLQ